MSSPWDSFLVHTVSVWRFFPGNGLDTVPDVNFPEQDPYAVDVPCDVQIEQSEQFAGGSVTQIDLFTVYFASNPGFRRKDLIRWTDPSSVVHKLYVTGVVDNTRNLIRGMVEVAAQERLF